MTVNELSVLDPALVRELFDLRGDAYEARGGSFAVDLDPILNNLRDALPDLHAKLSLPSPIVPALRDLKPDELDVLQLVLNFGRPDVVDVERLLARES